MILWPSFLCLGAGGNHQLPPLNYAPDCERDNVYVPIGGSRGGGKGPLPLQVQLSGPMFHMTLPPKMPRYSYFQAEKTKKKLVLRRDFNFLDMFSNAFSIK